MSSVYLDHAATTPVRPAVAEAIARAMTQVGNPSSLHGPGRRARALVESAREQLAAAVGAHPSEVIFTSGGTESDNLAVIGSYRAQRARDPRRTRLLVGATEHSAVLDAVDYLVRAEGAQATWVPPSPDGFITTDEVRRALTSSPEHPDGADVALLSAMWVNNEIGTITDVPALAHEARAHGVPMHCDAVQAVGHVDVNFASSGLAAMTLTGHKLGGPIGAGSLLVRRDAVIEGTSYGGAQERGLRSGTPAVPLLVGLALAVDLATSTWQAEAARQVALRDRLLTGILAAIPGARVTGAWQPGDYAHRSAANAHVLVPDCEGDSLLYLLDAAGIAASTGSACHAGVPQPSHVVLALGASPAKARGTLRLTLGWDSTDADVDALLAALPRAVARAQAAHAVGGLA